MTLQREGNYTLCIMLTNRSHCKLDVCSCRQSGSAILCKSGLRMEKLQPRHRRLLLLFLLDQVFVVCAQMNSETVLDIKTQSKVHSY